MSLLKLDTTKKRRIDEKTTKLEANNSKEYKVEIIWDSAVYTNEMEGYLPGLYYLVAWKRYPEEENIWEPSFGVQYLKKLINSFYKKYSEKPTATFPPINFALLMPRPTVKPTKTILKWTRDWPANITNKWARNWVLDAHDIWTIPSL